jgi:TolA-binding protein
MGQGLMMIKNQHLLAGLVVLGALNLLAFFSLIFRESDSARSLKAVEREVGALRNDQHADAEAGAARTEQLRQQLDEARGTIADLQETVEKLKTQLARTRETLDAVKERLDKGAALPANDRGIGR